MVSYPINRLVLAFAIVALFNGSLFALSESATPTSDPYWKKYVKTAQETTAKVTNQNPDRNGVRFNLGIRDFTEPLGLAIPFFELGYIRQQSDVEYHVEAQLGLARSKMRNNKFYYFFDSANNLYLFYNATMFSFGGGVDWRLKDFNMGLNGSYFILSDSSYLVSLSGLSVGAKISRPFTLNDTFILSPYFGVDYNFMRGLSLAGEGYRLSGIDGIGYSLGIHITSFF